MRPSGLQRLWSAYPVGSKHPVSRPAAREKRHAAAAADPSSSSPALEPVVFGFVSALAAAGILAAFLVLRPRLALSGHRVRTPRSPPSPLPEGPRMNVSMSRLFKGNDKQTNEPKPASAPTAAGARAPDERAQSAQSARVPTKPRGPDPDQASIEVGDQVATILASAKQAAEQLQVSARDDAKRIRGEAKQEAAARAQALERELAGKREEGAKLHSEAQAYSKRTREAADQYAAETRRRIDKESGKRHQEAEREANEIRAAARQQVETLSSEAVRRQKALTAETQRSEARLKQLLGVFRALTAQLEDLLGDERATASSADGPNLEKALKPPPLKDRPVQRARSADYAGHEDPDRDA
jgi:hypothetical protein